MTESGIQEIGAIATASIEQANPPVTTVLSFGSFRLFVEERLLEKDGVPVNLGSRALDILIALLDNPAVTVTKKDLLARVWQGVTVDEGSLRFHVAALRKALGDSQSGFRYVANVSGRGYCFVAPVSRWPAATPAVKQARPAGVPASLTRMVGREDSVQSISDELLAKRFVTIVGPGGIGKTTVAVAVSHGMLAAFEGAVHFADFGQLAAPHLVAGLLVSTLGLLVDTGDPAAILLAYLRDRRLLLVLDSCEHLIETVAMLTESLFKEAPQVHILATSRESLRVEGEQVHRLLPLSCPPDQPGLTAAAAMMFPAVRLFVDRAAASGACFELNDADAPLVGEICRRLDGIALALELAAGRLDAYGIRDIAALLDNQFALMWHGRRTALPRHQTLGATLDWSYNLLPEFEQVILRRLAVFVGAFPLEAAQTVAAEGLDEERTVRAIADLVSKSLLTADTSGPRARYWLLDTTRAYLLAKLGAKGERAATARRHADYYRQILDGDGIGSSSVFVTLEPDPYKDQENNIRFALEWSFSGEGDIQLRTALAAASAPFFLERSLPTECRLWAERSIAALPADAIGTRCEMKLQEALGVSLMFTKGNGEEALAALTRGLRLAEKLGCVRHQLRCLTGLNIFWNRKADYAIAADVAERGVVLAQTIADPTAIVMASWMRGITFHFIGDQKAAQMHCEASLRLQPGSRSLKSIQLGFDHRVRALTILARTLWLRGSADQAIAVAHRALGEADALGHPFSLCFCWIFVATIFLWIGDWPTAEGIINRLVAHTERHFVGPYNATALALKGELLLRQGDTKDGIDLLTTSLQTLEIERNFNLIPRFASCLAQGLATIGRFREVDVLLEDVLGKINSGEVDFYSSEVLRIKGDIIYMERPSQACEAEILFSRSLDIARRQSALAWELRTAVSLAHLRGGQGHRGAACEVLRPVFEQFTEGFTTDDLRTAKYLLDDCPEIPCGRRNPTKATLKNK